MVDHSFLVPMYNSQDTIESTIKTLHDVGEKHFEKFEIIIIDDCSSDKSFVICLELAKKYDNITLIQNPHNLGFAQTYKIALSKAIGQFVQYVPSDDAINEISLDALISNRHKDCAVLQYCYNCRERKFFRYLISSLYTHIVNFINSKNIKYYNGLNIYPRHIAQRAKLTSNNFSFQAELLLHVISDTNYVEVGTECRFTDENSTALNYANFLGVISYLLKSFFKNSLGAYRE